MKNKYILDMAGTARVRGITLVETLVAMAVGGIILAGGVAVYSDQVSSSKRLAAYSRLQNAGRVALDIIEKDIQMSGYIGCVSSLPEQFDPDEVDEDIPPFFNQMEGLAPETFQPEWGIQGWEAAGTGWGEQIENVSTETEVISTLEGNWVSNAINRIDTLDALPNSDVIRAWSTVGQEMPAQFGSVTSLLVQAGEEPEPGAIFTASDCVKTYIVQACAVADLGGSYRLTFDESCAPGNLAGSEFKFKQEDSIVVSSLVGITYFIGKANNSPENPPALFRSILSSDGAAMGEAQELVEGVESMQILYGEDLDENNLRSANTFVAADEIEDWTKVISVRVSLLLQSVEDNLSDAPVAYRYNGVEEELTADDNRLRRVFSRTITLRNRALGS